MSDKNTQRAENLRTVYRELCTSYRAIDDFRTKLLGFLPLATGAGIFFLVTNADKLNSADQINLVTPYFGPMGVFGMAVTLGLFFYELYGIKKCTALIGAGKELEKQLKIESGQFRERPHGVLGFISEPLAADVIYPAVLAAWTFIATAFTCPEKAKRLAVFVFVAGFSLSSIQNGWLIWKGRKHKGTPKAEDSNKTSA